MFSAEEENSRQGQRPEKEGDNDEGWEGGLTEKPPRTINEYFSDQPIPG